MLRPCFTALPRLCLVRRKPSVSVLMELLACSLVVRRDACFRRDRLCQGQSANDPRQPLIKPGLCVLYITVGWLAGETLPRYVMSMGVSGFAGAP